MFSDHKPIYFVFENKGDTYYLDSMIALASRNYLWYKLRKSEYRAIFFLQSDANDKTALLIPDVDSFRRNTYKDSWFNQSKPLWDTKNNEFEKAVTISAPNQTVVKWMLERAGEQNTAMICNPTTLRKLLPAGNAAPIKDLIRKTAKNKASIILQLPMELEPEDLAFLIGEDSIFRESANGQSLFEPLQQLLSAGHVVSSLFDELRKQAPQQILEIGYLDFESVRVLFSNVEFALEKNFRENEFYDHVNYLYYWVNFEIVRRDSGGLFSSMQGAVTRKKLFDALVSGGLTALREREEMLRRLYRQKYPQKNMDISLATILCDRYGPKKTDVSESHIWLDIPALRRLQALEFPKNYDKTSKAFTIRTMSPQEWNTIRRSIAAPASLMPRPERCEQINMLCGYAEDAITCGDMDTAKRAMNLLSDCIRRFYTEPDEPYREYCRQGRAYLDTSRQYYSLVLELTKLNGMIQGAHPGLEAQMVLRKTEAKKCFDILQYYDTKWLFAEQKLGHDKSDGNHVSELERLVHGMTDEEAYQMLEDENKYLN